MQEPDDAFADVTVIIPAYNAQKTIARALSSVAEQTLKPRAIVVIDDGSRDDTYAVAQRHSDQMRGIELVVIRQPNAGPGAARNRAIAEAKTTYIAFLDADDEWLRDKLARTMSFLGDGQFVLVAHDSMEIDGNLSKRLDCARRFREAIAAPYVGLYRRGFIDTSTVVVRLDAVRAVGCFDVTLPNAQDFALWLAVLADPAARFMIFDEVLSHYHRQPGSVMTHIARRRRYCLIIARNYALALRRHPGSPVLSFWFRILAIHSEAIAAHINAREWLSAIGTLAILPAEWVRSSISYLADLWRSDRIGTR